MTIESLGSSGKSSGSPHENRDIHRATRRAVLVALAAFWGYATLANKIADFLTGSHLNWQQSLVAEASFTFVGIVLSVLIYCLIKSLQRISLGRLAIVNTGIAVASAYLQFGLYVLLASTFQDAAWPQGVNFFYQMVFWTHFYIAWSGTVLAIIFSVRTKFEQRARSRAQELAHRGRMLALRYQLNPHFLFNALNSLAALILDRRPEVAERTIQRLSSFLRRSLGDNPFSMIALSRELDRERDYLAIEAERFGERMDVRIDLPPHLRRALVPSLLLQPLVENAIKHGVACSTATVTISISARNTDKTLTILISEDSTGHSARELSGTGTGVANVRERLRAIYGDRASITAGAGHAGGYQSEIVLPLEIGSRNG